MAGDSHWLFKKSQTVALYVGSWQGWPRGTPVTRRPPSVLLSWSQSNIEGQQASPGKHLHVSPASTSLATIAVATMMEIFIELGSGLTLPGNRTNACLSRIELIVHLNPSTALSEVQKDGIASRSANSLNITESNYVFSRCCIILTGTVLGWSEIQK